MGKLIAAERQKEILKKVQEYGSVKISQLASTFDVSMETIRRDLAYLDDIGAVQKTHGGATSAFEFGGAPIESRISKDSDIKRKLCEKALDYLPSSGVIYIDCGSTMTHMAQLLSKQSGHTIVTSSLSVANTLIHSDNTTILTGGQLDPNNLSMEGFQTTNFINNLKVAVSFLGTNGFEQHKGPAVSAFADAQTKQSIVPNSKQVIVISDSSKATTSALIQYANWKDIDCFITDNHLPSSIYQKISEVTTVILVDIDEAN
ncbi:MAG: DeoR/GlpR family DNA-binding transcription regulator [Anaerostipes sp.]|nr:DeoR/GlpR family DNA-binding transcription regulator [Anaerostipes sp.]MDD3745828.1 DeoR/GlpR family DNA-binding transcription regulator [Anaerostipes sp.]